MRTLPFGKNALMLRWFKSKIQSFFQVSLQSGNVFSISEVEKNIRSFFASLTLIYRGMNNMLEFGNSGIQNVVTYRRAWIMSKDTSVYCEDGHEAEEEWIKEFDRYNIMPLLRQRMATNGEIEGKVVIVLMVDAENQRIYPRVFNYLDYTYDIVMDNFFQPVQLQYQMNKVTVKVPKERFVYTSMSMSETYLDARITPSCVAFVLENIINSDKAYQNWRYINDRFAKTTPVFETETWDDALRISRLIRGKAEDGTNTAEIGKKWKVGEGLAIKGKVSQLSFNMQGIDSLKSEIIANAQKISGHTGIPIFLLGFPELIGGGRATAEEMAEAITNKTITERIIWENKLKELYQKAMSLSNEMFGTTLNPDCVSVKIPAVSLAEVNAMIATYESAVDKKYISKKTFRDMMPGIDNDTEEERLAEEAKAGMIQMQESMTGVMGDKKNSMPLPGFPGKPLEGVK